ncbi:benzoate 4-monooxygenase cytochrome P450 [Clohesyomyces aquaticus]|uniref:Benzoate 4-monooxygenase cytochrome P450 n=1 Tax=Clohesyomyces aquaticus TaxID=1231657 RepID=A0A1Y1YID9_9PLEO|nr:benzoate 4-monooxygenase cytochrome P450 [Clohesyomyces aquaticus]
MNIPLLDWWFGCAVTLLVLVLRYFLARRCLSSLRNVSGPFTASLTVCWQFYHMVIKSDYATEIVRQHRKHGTFVRIGPNEVSVSHPDAVCSVLMNQWWKSSWYRIFSFPDHTHLNLASHTDPKLRSHMWRTVGPGYTLANVSKTEPYVDECIVLLEQQLESLSKRGQAIDFDEWFAFLSLDIIGQATFSSRLGYLDAGRDIGLAISTVKVLAVYTTIMSHLVWLHDLTLGNPWLGKLGIAPNVKMVDICTPIIKARRENLSPRKDMMAEWLSIREKSPEKMKDSEIDDAALLNVVAGAEGTGGVIQALFYFLLRAPKHLERLRAELDNADANGQLSPVAQIAETQKLTFLQACIKETYRFYCPIGAGMPRVVPNGGAQICGRYFKSDTILSVNAYAIHRNPDIFGADCDTFNPERWLNISDQALMTPLWGAGYNKCAGQHLAHFEICKVAATLIRDFDFGQIHPELKWIQPQGFTCTPHGWPCWVKRRGQHPRGEVETFLVKH